MFRKPPVHSRWTTSVRCEFLLLFLVFIFVCKNRAPYFPEEKMREKIKHNLSSLPIISIIKDLIKLNHLPIPRAFSLINFKSFHFSFRVSHNLILRLKRRLITIIIDVFSQVSILHSGEPIWIRMNNITCYWFSEVLVPIWQLIHLNVYI